jgi:hypothetical protein
MLRYTARWIVNIIGWFAFLSDYSRRKKLQLLQKYVLNEAFE